MGDRREDRFAEELAALHRVATLVARSVAAEDVFAAVSAEVGRVVGCDFTVMSRYDPDDMATVVAAWAPASTPVPGPVGTRLRLGEHNLHTRVARSHRPARLDSYGPDAGVALGSVLTAGLDSAVGAPIDVDGRLWGVMIAASRAAPLPADTEARLAGFAELVATAIANAQARMELRGFAEEQAALRRVATLVAQGRAAEEVFAAVAAEVGRVLGCEFTVMSRYGPGDKATVVGEWTAPGAPVGLTTGQRLSLGDRNLHTLVARTHRPARLDSYGPDAGEVLASAVAEGLRSAVGVPIDVDGRLWGVMIVASRATLLPADIEARLAGFTELVATAIANADAQAALTASRARIVAAGDQARRRIERDLHDGAQQRLVALTLRVEGPVKAVVPPEADKLTEQLNGVSAELRGVLEELRELARGIHPSALADGGLKPALKTLGRRSTIPVHFDVWLDGRLPEPVELAAYFSAAELLTNTAKHADASRVDIAVAARHGVLRIEVRDDGRGGADLAAGSGLVGLTDRIEALGGRLTVRSPPGAGTTATIALPLDPTGRPPVPRLLAEQRGEAAGTQPSDLVGQR